MKIHTSITSLIGHTPLLALTNYSRNHTLPATILAKLEGMNPGGSAKDRVALSMIADAEKRGVLAPGGLIIEPTNRKTAPGRFLPVHFQYLSAVARRRPDLPDQTGRGH